MSANSNAALRMFLYGRSQTIFYKLKISTRSQILNKELTPDTGDVFARIKLDSRQCHISILRTTPSFRFLFVL